jgi:hypothetical protein
LTDFLKLPRPEITEEYLIEWQMFLIVAFSNYQTSNTLFEVKIDAADEGLLRK